MSELPCPRQLTRPKHDLPFRTRMSEGHSLLAQTAKESTNIRARKDAECESLPRVLFRKEGYSPLFLKRIQSKTHQRFRDANAGHDLMRARPRQPNHIFIRRCDQMS
jgi:hypothetical protein